MNDYITIAIAKIEQAERDNDPLMFDEFIVPLLLELITRQNTTISLLEKMVPSKPLFASSLDGIRG